MPGSPTFEECESQTRAVTDFFETYRKFVDDTLLAKLEAIEAAIEGDHTGGLADWVASRRAQLSAVMSRQTARAGFAPILMDFAKVIGRPARNPVQAKAYLREYMEDNSLTTEERSITFGAWSKSSGTGDGAFYRLTVGPDGTDLDSGAIEARRAVCIRDQNTGADEHAEVFRVEGAKASPDWVQAYDQGSGLTAEFTASHAGSGDGGSILRNSSFTQFDTSAASSATDKVTDWDITSNATNIATSTTTFRDHPGIGTQTDRSLNLSGDCTIRQKLSSIGRSLNPNSAYLFLIRYQRQSSCDGDLAISLGSTTATVDLTGASNGSWATLVPTLDENLYSRNLSEADVELEIDLSSNTTGNVLIDDVVVVEFQFFDGTGLVLVGGATAWLVEAEYAATDSGGDPNSGGEIEYWMGRVGGYGPLPNGSSPTFADPT